MLLWNFGAGRFYSISGIPLDTNAPALGPGRVREWLIKGRLPAAGKARSWSSATTAPSTGWSRAAAIDIGGKPFTVVGVVDIKEGSQIAASNFYMDIDEARALAGLPAGLVNQVFLKVADMAETENVKQSIAAWLPRASIASPGTMLQLFGGVSQTIGRFGPMAVGDRRRRGTGLERDARSRRRLRTPAELADCASSAGTAPRFAASWRSKWPFRACSEDCWRSRWSRSASR